jgi:cytochrome b561
MSWRNSKARYGSLTISLHWLMLLLLVAVYASMELRGYFPKGSPEREAMKTWHYMLGLSVLGLAGLRMLVAALGPLPDIVPPIARWQSTTAWWMKLALYLFMFAMPLLGWLTLSAKGTAVPFFGLVLPPLIGQSKELASSIKEVHEAIATVGYVLIGLHAAAGLYHHYFLHDNTLRRILPTVR